MVMVFAFALLSGCTAFTQRTVAPLGLPKDRVFWTLLPSSTPERTILEFPEPQDLQICVGEPKLVVFSTKTMCTPDVSTKAQTDTCFNFKGTHLSMLKAMNSTLRDAYAWGTYYYLDRSSPWAKLSDSSATQEPWSYSGANDITVAQRATEKPFRVCVDTDRHTVNLEVIGGSCGVGGVAVTGIGCVDLMAKEIWIRRAHNPSGGSTGYYRVAP
jgi:hypothetical protein